MTENNQILPFYLSLDRQYHRLYRAFGEIAPLLAPGGHLPPFQLRLPTNHSTLAYTVDLVDILSGAVTSVRTPMTANGLVLMTFAGRDYISLIYPSIAIVPNLPNGTYYYRIAFTGGQTFFSEVFTVCDNRGQIRILWHNDEDFEVGDFHFDYSANFRFFIYLETEFGKPTYPYEDTVHRRDGVDFIEKIISSKVYRCETIQGEPCLDGMRLIRLHSDIFVETGGVQRRVFDLAMAVEWDEVGFYATITLDLQTETIVKQTGKGRI